MAKKKRIDMSKPGQLKKAMDEVARTTQKAIKESESLSFKALLEVVGVKVMEVVLDNTPFDTGNLLNSNKVNVVKKDEIVEIRNTANYAVNVEFGLGSNAGKGPRPFVGKGRDWFLKYGKKAVGEVLEQEIKDLS